MQRNCFFASWVKHAEMCAGKREETMSIDSIVLTTILKKIQTLVEE